MLSSQAGDHASSALWRRIVLTRTDGSGRAAAEWQQAFRRHVTNPDVEVLSWVDDVVATLRAIVSGFEPGHHEGTGAFAPAEVVAVALRTLIDELVLLAHPGLEVLIVPVTDLTAWHAIAPDAIVIDSPTALDGAVVEAQGASPIAVRKDTMTKRLGTDRLVVIVGCARSGTTLLENLLMSHPQVGGITSGESFVFHDLRATWALLTSTHFSAWLARGDAAHLLRHYCDSLFAAGLEGGQSGETYFVEKTPLHSMCLPMITELYPDAWIVHLLRDGRDVARSLSEVEIFPNLGMKMDARRGAQLWVQVVTEIQTAAPAIPRFRTLRYEALVAHPVDESVGLLEWVELGTDETTRGTIAATSTRRVSVHGTTGEAGPGKWEGLSGWQLARVLHEAGGMLVAEGYLTEHEATKAQRGIPGLLAKLLP